VDGERKRKGRQFGPEGSRSVDWTRIVQGKDEGPLWKNGKADGANGNSNFLRYR